jgi:cytochrome bd-type quinol oxidase subunit 2
MKKVLASLLVVLLMVLAVGSVALAAPNDPPEPGSNLPGTVDPQTLVDKIEWVVRWLQYAGGVLLVLALVIAGYKLMMSSSRPQARAEAMDALKWAIIGGVIVFGAWVIAAVARSFAPTAMLTIPLRFM